MVAEVIKELPIVAVLEIGELFNDWYMGLLDEDVEFWKKICMFFIRKESSRKRLALSDFRGISLLSVVLKWYICALVLLLDATPVPEPWSEVPVGGESASGADLHIHAATIMLQRSQEWWTQCPCYGFCRRSISF